MFLFFSIINNISCSNIYIIIILCMCMVKKGQVTIFIIFSVILIASLSLIFFMKDDGTEQHDDELDTDDVKRVRDFVEGCISEELENGMNDIYYKNIDELEAFLDYNVEECIDDFSSFGDLEVIAGDLVFDVELINEDQQLNINLDYPLEIVSTDKNNKIDSFFMKHPLTSKVILDISSGKTIQDQLLVSPDNKFQLQIKKGTVALTQNGKNIDEIELEMVSKETFKSPYNHIVGKITYKMGPAGATFSPPLELKYVYEDSDLHGYVDEGNMKFSFYEEEPKDGVYWKNYGGGRVDSQNNVIYADIDHFTVTAPTEEDDNVEETVLDSDNPTATCGEGEPNLVTPTSWCNMDCNAGVECAEGLINCDCYGHCGGTGGPGDCSTGGDYLCEEVIDGENTDGFFSLLSFKEELYAGAFGYGHEGESMLFNLEGGRVSPGITGIAESICVMREFNDAMYANTESDGKIYKSNDGENWEMVYDAGGSLNVGCGLTVKDDYIYASESHWDARKSIIVRSGNGKDWEQVNSNDLYLRELVTHEDKIYGFGVDSSDSGKVLTSTDGVKWETGPVDARFFRGNVNDGTLWIGSAALYSDSGKSGIWRQEAGDFEEVHEDDSEKDNHITYIKSWKGNLFAGSTQGWKEADGPTDLLISENEGETWGTACSIPDAAIWDLEVHDDILYVAGWDFKNGGKVYEVSVNNVSYESFEGGEDGEDNNDGETSGRFHHTQTNGPDGGQSLVLCEGQGGFDKCSAGNLNLPYHGKDEGRLTYWNMGGSSLQGIVCTKGGNTYKFPVRNGAVVYGNC